MLRTNIPFFFFPVLSRCLSFSCQTRVLWIWRMTFFKTDESRVELSSLPRTALWLRGGGRESPRPHWWEGAVAGCMRLYWKRNLCCSNSFFCCSLDCQDVLNISVLWAWCFNKKRLSVQPLCPFVHHLGTLFEEAASQSKAPHMKVRSEATSQENCRNASKGYDHAVLSCSWNSNGFTLNRS